MAGRPQHGIKERAHCLNSILILFLLSLILQVGERNKPGGWIEKKREKKAGRGAEKRRSNTGLVSFSGFNHRDKVNNVFFKKKPEA